MRVTPGRVHDERARVLADGLGKGLGAVLDNDVAPTNFAGERGVEGRPVEGVLTVLEGRDNDFVFEARFTLKSESWREEGKSWSCLRLGP